MNRDQLRAAARTVRERRDAGEIDEAEVLRQLPALEAEKRRLDQLDLNEDIRKLGAMFEGAGEGGYARARGRDLHAAIFRAGWQLGGPAVQLPIGALLIDEAGDAAPLRAEPGIVREGMDTRRLYPALERQPLNGATRIDVLVSTGRVLADPGAMQLPIGATTEEKPVTSSGAVLQSFDVGMVATISDPYPNAIVGLDAFRDLVNDDLTVAFEDSLDNLVVDTLTVQAGTIDDAGADLFEQLRKAVTVLQGEGFTPALAAVSPAQAELLDLTRAGSGGDPTEGPFLLTPSPRASAFSPLWSLQVRVVKDLTAAIVLDPAAVRLYADDAQFAADPFSGFSRNTSRFRIEAPAVVVVRQPKGLYVVAAGS